jgi:hypothetical protein
MEQPCALQSRQPGPAGDQHHTLTAARQQRADLRLRDGIIQHDEYPAARQSAAVERSAFFHTARDRAPVYAHGAQEPAQHLAGV